MPFLFPALRRITLACLPFAAVFAVGLTLPKSVSAQYPGGGGYPGGGPAPGWKLLPNPNAGTPQYPVYDWIGFDDQITRTPFNSAPQIQTVHSYGGGAEGNVDGGNYMMEYPFNGTGGSGNTLAEANAKIKGTAQYKWQWVPPTIAGQPDWIDFPAPPLFTLADVYALAWTRASNNTGLAATGALSDGLPDNWSAALTKVPQQIGDIVPRRAALPTVVEPLGVQSVSMSPAGNLDVTGQQTVLQGGYLGPGGTGISAIAVSALAFPITLTLPDPLTNPMLGGGGNPYVYDRI